MSYVEMVNADIDVYRIDSTNRIAINTDGTTLSFTEDGKLTVTGGGGANIRVSDYRGCFFDTTPNAPTVAEFVSLGPGLKIVGGNIPVEMTISDTSAKDAMLELIKNASAIELFEYHNLQSAVPWSKISLGGLAGSVAMMSTEITQMQLADVLAAYENWNAAEENINDILNESVVRMYLSESYLNIYNRAFAILESIHERDDQDVLFQRIVTHYNLSCTADLNGIVSQLMTMDFIDTTQDNPYLFDWFFSLGFMEAE
jgi:hypothetical protein